MSKLHTGVVTDAELLSLGVIPGNTLGSRRDIISQPLDVQHGENRITRSSSGTLGCEFGYYSPSQRLFRKVWAKKLVAEIEKNCPHLFGAKSV